MKKILGISVAIIMLVGGIVAIVYQFSNRPKNHAILETEFLVPYFEMVNAKRFDESWSTFTTDEYKKTYPLNAYMAHWEKTLGENGPVLRQTIRLANKGRTNDGLELYNLTIFAHFEKTRATIAYTINRDRDGKLRINGAANRTLATKAEPW